MNKYTRLFIDETRSYLDTIVQALPTAPGEGGGDLGEARRLAHSIKGMALFEEQSAVAGLAYALGALVIGSALLAAGVHFTRSPRVADARRLLRATIVYLPVLLLLIVADALL